MQVKLSLPAPNQRGLRKIMLDHEQFASRITQMTQDLNTISSVIGALSYCKSQMKTGKIAAYHDEIPDANPVAEERRDVCAIRPVPLEW
jgi:hypothetical protein